MPDERIVYGAGCTWWDSIDKAGKAAPSRSGHRLPGCPHCGGLLYELDNERLWWAGVDGFAARTGNAGYRNMIEWSRGKCFKNVSDMKAAYDQEQKWEHTCPDCESRN